MKHMRFAISFLILGLTSNSLFASHGMGGELTWTCQGNAYVFTMKFYRDCNGIPGPSNPALTTNVPGVPSIPLTQITLTDISPTGSNTSGIQPCPVCPAGGVSGGGVGAVHEYVYRSNPVILPGTPPATGWVFAWGECCRSNALTNMVGAGGLSMGIRAVMYPYVGFIAGQCRDNSPYFAEKPNVIICTGYPFTYNHNAIDNELDSLVYSWDSPVSSPPITPQAYSAGYSVNSPLPGPLQNPANVPAALNPQNGEITFTSYTQGYFVTVVKVTAYKCNTKAAEIFREINVVLIGGCVLPCSSPLVQNLPPLVTIINRKTGQPINQNKDTVCVGDTVKLRIIASDPDCHPTIGVQSVTFTITGSELSNPAHFPNGTCLIMPCAYTSAPLPLTALFGTQMDFDWPISCAHLGFDTLCTRISNTFNFVIKVKDNYCPAPGLTTNTLSITIKRCREIGPPELRCASVENANGDVRLHWKPETPRDTFGLFYKYNIEGSLSAGGPYVVIDSIYTPVHNFTTNQLFIPAIKLVSLLGTHAQDNSIYFRMNTYSGCFGDSISIYSNIIRTMKLNADTGQSNAAILTWNSVHVPLLPTNNPWYYIYREYPAGTWTMIDSLLHPPGIFYDTILTYVDTFPRQLCDDIIVYRIRTSDSLYCDSWSSFDTIDVSNNTPIAAITPPSPAICQGGNINLTASPGGSVYQWSTGASTQTITVSSTGTYTVTITYNPGGCTATATATVQQVTPCTPTWSASPTSYCAGGSSTLIIDCAGGSGPAPASYTYSYTNVTTGQVFGPFTTATLPVNIPVSPASTTTYQLTSFIANYPTFSLSCPGSPLPANITVTVNPLPTASISVSGSTAICEGQSTNIQFNFTGTGPWTYSYNTPSGVVGPLVTATTPINVAVSPTSTFNYTLVSTSNALCNGTVSGSALVTVNTLPQATISGTTAICENQSATLTVNFANAPGPYSFTYNPGNVVVNNVTNPYTFNVTPSGNTNYTLVTVSNANCTGTVLGNASITVNQLPSALISGTPEICNGDQTTIEVAFTGVAPFTYRYSDGSNTYGPFVAASSPVSINVSPSVSTNYTLISVDDANCSGSVSGNALVTVHQLPTAQIAGTTTICDGDQTNLNFTFNGVAPFTYFYSDGTNTYGPFVANSTNTSIPVNPTATTTYTVTTIEDANCTGTVSGSATITVTQLPSATLSGTTTICNGQSANITVNFTGVAPFEYSYTDGTNIYGPFTTSSNPVNISVSPTITTNYALTATVVGAGCNGSTSGNATVTVNQIPFATISGNSTICNGDQTSFDITFNGVAPFTYSYSDGSNTYGPFVSAASTVNIPVNPTVTTTYTVVFIADNNCTGTASGNASVTVNQLPQAQISGNTAICDSNTTALIITFTGVSPFTYSYSDGSSTYGPFTTVNNPETITVQPSVTTSYSLIAVADANCNGSVSGAAVITVNELPSAVISQDSEVCFGQQTNFMVTFTGTAPFTFYYTNGLQTFGPVTTSSNPAFVQVSPATTQTYTLVSVSDANCPGSVSGSANVIVNPLPTPVITGISAICEGEETTFDAGAGYISYAWSNGQTTQTININTSGTYIVTVTDGNGCQNSDDQFLTVNQTPVVSFSNDTSLTCADPVINFINQSTYPAGSSFSWTFGNAGTSTLANPSQTFAQPGIYTVTLVITTQAGCTDSASKDVEIIFYPLPVAEFTANPKETGIFNSKIKFTDLSQHAVSWWWDFGDGRNSPLQHPEHYFDEIGKFLVTLTVKNIAGCESTYRESVYITPFFVPNAFTPNSDGLNENFFEAGYIIDVSSYNMSIFNRWGQKVFENDSHYKPWNGLDKNGKPAPEGVYVYAIKVKTLTGKDYFYTGRVSLLR